MLNNSMMFRCQGCGQIKSSVDFTPSVENTPKGIVLTRSDTCQECLPKVEMARKLHPQDNWWLQFLWEEARRERAIAREEWLKRAKRA